MSLHILVEQFGEFVRNAHEPAEAKPEPAFPAELQDLRDAINHHLIPLLLLARSDRDFASEERDVIVSHCMAMAEHHGALKDASHTEALQNYAANFRPTLLQLAPALARLARGDHQEFAALVKAARHVVMSDGIARPEEERLLARLRTELDGLSATA